jgi:quinol-cytochrome oxidoreductase complex cytochrome b subunit
MDALRRVRGWSGDAQFTLVAALVLVVSPVLPWLDYPGVESPENVPGIDFNAGMLCLVVGVVAVWVLNRPAGPRAAATSGALGALALLAGGLVLDTMIRHWNDPVAPKWGLYLTGLAALALLVGSFVLQSDSEDSLGPPD